LIDTAISTINKAAGPVMTGMIEQAIEERGK